MVMWGAVFGALLALMWSGGGDWSERIVAGLVIGAAAGATLRSAIRSEVRKALADRSLAARPVVTQPAAVAPPATTAAPVSTPAPIPKAPRATPAQPDFVAALLLKARDWLLGGNVVVRVGVLVLFVGLAFLAKYAIDNALLPPQLRLAGIGAAGIALFVAGFRLREQKDTRRAYAMTLQGGGVAVLYLTVFAAFRLYQFLPAGAAFGALALICAFSAAIAVAEDAIALAFIGLAGGFAAPILVSTGEGSHVALFSYYLLLGVAIAALSWVKAWRALNLLGFFATFAIATAWGVLKYRPEDFASTEPFLIAFFAVYLAAALIYALRHALASVRAVDATLIFGVPLVGFGLQAALVRDIEYASAFSALALGALYLALAAWMLRSRTGDAVVRSWLAECFVALGLGFATLAVPLALEARWTSAVWAVEGAAVFWMGRRQGRWLARLVGLGLQLLAAFAFIDSEAWRFATSPALAHPAFLGATMLAASAFFVAWHARSTGTRERTGIDAQLAAIEPRLAPVLFWAGFLWWQFALHKEIGLVEDAMRTHLHMVAWVASAFALHWLAGPRLRHPWPTAATPAWTVLPVLFASALFSLTHLNHVFQSGGWIAWPIVLAMHAMMLRRLDAGPPRAWWPWVHAGGVWLMVLLVGNLLVYAVGRAQLWQTAWASVILLVASVAVLLVLSMPALFDEQRARRHWPLDRFARDYLWRAAAPLAVGVAFGSLLVAVHSDGNARPLPYIPLLNPTDLAVALGLAACALWLVRLRECKLQLPQWARDPRSALVLAGISFIALNTVWLRVAHHFADVPWNAPALFDSFVVQAGYSILWTSIAVVLMVLACRRAQRPVWMLGAGLLALTVAKLFVIDLSNRGGSERIVAFIAVGVLMLLVGWFAPMPPAARRAEAAS
ncbi:MAG TPA: DUF2339 domain-containing protein [Ramlibacter sp.]|nr:DUF2339 domain-containing protein [Ramlibacter sp.]